MGKILGLFNKRLIIILIIFLIGSGTTIGFALWDQAVREDEGTIDLGDMAFLEVEQTLSPNVVLVPYGSYKGENEVDSFIFVYQVSFNKLGNLRISIDEASILIGDGNHAFNDLVVLEIYTEESIYEHREYLEHIIPFNELDDALMPYGKLVYVRMYVKSPEDTQLMDEAYYAIRGQSIRFKIFFEALEIEN